MTPTTTPSTPNPLEARHPELFAEVKEFRNRFEEMLLASVDEVLDNPRFRDRGHFLPKSDLKAIAQVMRVLTSESWNQESYDRFDAHWKDALRSDLFAEAFESIRFRIENAVQTGRARLTTGLDSHGVTQGTFW